METVMNMLNCTAEEAEKYLTASGGNVLDAIERNLVIPATPGNAHIPPKTVIDDGLTPEVREKLVQARKLSEMFSASFRNDLLVNQKPSEIQEVELPTLK
jgi:hypothetical protein